MRTFKQILTFSLFIAIFSALNPVSAETAGHMQNNPEWPGIYLGFIPCDDCKGIKTTLALNKNNSYLLISQYIGKSEREIVEKGKFAWDDKNNTIVMSPRNGSTTRKYFVGENELVQLDDNGNRFTGKLADRYVLRRNERKEPSSSHSSH